MRKILIVEDNKFLLNDLRIKLQRAGFEIMTAVDGRQAIQVLEESIPDLILLDLVMPIKDGFAVLEELKAVEKWKSIPVLITSNLSQKEDIEKGMALGAVDYIIKGDLSINDLIAKINSILKDKK